MTSLNLLRYAISGLRSIKYIAIECNNLMGDSVGKSQPMSCVQRGMWGERRGATGEGMHVSLSYGIRKAMRLRWYGFCGNQRGKKKKLIQSIGKKKGEVPKACRMLDVRGVRMNG